MRQRRYRGITEVGHIHVKEEKQKDLEKIVIGVLKYSKEVRELSNLDSWAEFGSVI